LSAAGVWVLLAALLSGMAGCSASRVNAPGPDAPTAAGSKPYKVMGRWYQPRDTADGFRQEGLASWYGKQFHGRRTSNGEIYDMYAVSAAHKTLPFNTVVRVHNLDNGRHMDIRINDRGPFVNGRIIDLSYGAARKLGVVGPGTARVRIVALGVDDGRTGNRQSYRSVDYNRGRFTFQVGAFRERDNAERLKRKLERQYPNAHITTFDSGAGIYYRVRVGMFSSLDEARQGEDLLVRDGYDPFIVAD
jgi:rare lipoprotein A